MKAIQQRFPDALQEWISSAEDIWIYENGQYSERTRIRVGHEELRFAVNYFTARLVAAVHYDRIGVPLPHGSCISCEWNTNIDLLTKKIPPEILELATEIVVLEQGKKNSLGQFSCRYKIENGLGVFVFSFHEVMVTYAFLFGNQDGDHHPSGYNFVTSPSGLKPVNRPWPANLR